MNIQTNPGALGLGAYQAILAIIGLVILAWLGWRAIRHLARLRGDGTPLAQRDLLAALAPPFVWGVILIAGAIAFSTYQAFGPRLALPRTELTPLGPPATTPGPVRDLTPAKTTDTERLEQQRRLERETRERVGLPKDK